MKFRSLMTAICVLATANIVSAAVAPFAYIANSGTNNVSVIRTDTNAVTATVALPVGTQPYAYSIAVSPSGQYVYVGIQGTNKIAIIDAATNTVLSQFLINLGSDRPGGLAINTAETRLYVASSMSNTLNVFDITNVKIGSGSIPEVGRVTVENVAISNPEGVVLSPNGLKAYVANSTKGSIAEISLDETNNLYLRTNLIPLGNNAQPMGLTINSDGSKLYAAGFNGHASVIDTASRAVTNLPLGVGPDGTGNLSVAITPDNGKVYAPSAGYNNLYSISGTTVTPLGGQNSLLNSPWGSSVAPVTPVTDPTKLYVAMNLSNDVKVFNTADNSLLATIVLTATAGENAKPTSMGDFIGPEFLYTITSAAQTGCTISPLGTIPVTNMGRPFSFVATSGLCEVFTGTTSCTPTLAGGTSQGFLANYNYVNGTANGTICAKNIPTYTLSGDWSSNDGGCLQSDGAFPLGISCERKGESAKFPVGSTVTLTPNAGHQVQPGTWAGACAGSSTSCTILMDADKSFGTTTVVELMPVVAGGPIKNETRGTYHTTLSDATSSASSIDVIKVSTDYTTGGTTSGTPGVTVKMSSQWKSSDYTTIDSPFKSPGAITITTVAVIADGLVI